MKMVKIWCECGRYFALTKIQYNDFEDGICGILNCTKCKKNLLPIDKEVNCLLEEVEINGDDPGWNGALWIKMIKSIREKVGNNISLIIPGNIEMV